MTKNSGRKGRYWNGVKHGKGERFGIGLIQKIAKEASWKYENGNNVLTLTFER